MRSPTFAVWAYVRANGGCLHISRKPPTVPLTKILRKVGFLKSQNLRNNGTLCSLIFRLEIQNINGI